MKSKLDEIANEVAQKLQSHHPKGARIAKTKCFADIEPQGISWLWKSRIALGKLTIIAGDPGLGKSMLSASLAAHVTTGKEWPDGAACKNVGDVVLVSAEDDPADTIRPRLDAAGADVSRVHLLDCVVVQERDGTRRHIFSLEDVQALDRLLAETKAILVVIDPVSAYLGGTDSHKNADVRALLAPLAEVAARHKVSIVGITHLNKGGGAAMYRAMGSLAFVAAARAAYLVAKDPDTPDRRLLLPIKNNVGDDKTGMAYSIAEGENGAPLVVWEREIIQMSADEALTPDDERNELEEAQEFLIEVLKLGSKPASDVIKEARSAGIAERTLRRAKKKLGIKSTKQPVSKKWSWRLSETSTKVAKVAKVAKITNGKVGNVDQNLTKIANGNVKNLGNVGNVGNVDDGGEVF